LQPALQCSLPFNEILQPINSNFDVKWHLTQKQASFYNPIASLFQFLQGVLTKGSLLLTVWSDRKLYSIVGLTRGSFVVSTDTSNSEILGRVGKSFMQCFFCRNLQETPTARNAATIESIYTFDTYKPY
jgi:hypothetical protein